MATDDQQVLVTGTASAPTHFTIPGNGQIQPKAIFAHFNGASAATAFVPALKVISDGGETVAICPCPTTVAAAGSADVSWFPHVAVLGEAGTGAGVTLEQFFLDSTSTGVTSSTVLVTGEQYLITVQGTFSLWNSALNFGTPNADAMFPGSLVGRNSTQVGNDADTEFAAFNQPGSYPQHAINFQMDLGGGYVHVEPDGGPFATPQPNYLYHYTVTGQGSAASFRVLDTPIADNYGKLQITIQDFSGSGGGGGGGAGSLLPPTSVSNALLRAVSGVPTWQAQPSITESDLSLSNVTTANVSTSRHGFAPKAPNDATKFLDGTGAYSVPPGGGTISDLTSTGSTITVTNPTGPTTNVDLPTTGVTAGSYGDASHSAMLTVDAEGRVTAASSVGISGGSGTIGFEIGYDQITASVNIGSTNEASPTTIITCAAHTFDGAPVLAHFFTPFLQNSTSGFAVTVALWEGSSEITRLGVVSTGAATPQLDIGVSFFLRFTPSAASHTYLVRAHASSLNGTPLVAAGAGSGASYPPAFIRFTKV